MKSLTLIALACALAACGSKPAQPDWKMNAQASLEAFSDAYLKGDTAIADSEFARARRAMSSTGRPDLVAHAELYRCATRAASLEYDTCPGFLALGPDVTPAGQAYAAYLKGHLHGLDAALLPEQHRAIAQGKGTLAAIPDPLSRLVAAGVLLKAERLTPADIVTATDTASEQGWRRPLLMWLGISLQRAQKAGNAEEAARIQRRIELAGKTSN